MSETEAKPEPSIPEREINYTPVNRERYDRMLTFFREAGLTPETLQAAVNMYVGDLSYDRGDILMARKIVSREKRFE